MIRIREITLPFDHAPDALKSQLAKGLNIAPEQILNFTIIRKSIDARQKNNILAVYTIDAEIKNQDQLSAILSNKITICPPGHMDYQMPTANKPAGARPVIVGTGPCGLFAGLLLAQLGHKPILIDRGKEVTQRIKDVNNFWRNGILNPESNVQFGQGGAGTFSDGKLTTQIKDKLNRSRKVLNELVKAGAPKDILYQAKPHIGSDNLITVVKKICETITALGGQVLFETKLTSVKIKDSKVTAAVINDCETIETDKIVLALGHSARDTFKMLAGLNIPITAKPFSIGVRVEHPQSMINKAQFGQFANNPLLGSAEYKLVQHCENGRSAYTFCMCPGGQVIASSSETDAIVTNGMSFYKRNRPNANSALLVGLTPEDFQSNDPLAGIDFQRKWEQKAYQLAGENYSAPIQLIGDFLANKPSTETGQVTPSYTPSTTPTDLSRCLPDFVIETLRLAIPKLNNKLKGFADHDAVMTAVESRSSSPVRILRDKTFQSPAVIGLYPAGEGAGYAGGIISAAIDGIKTAEAIVNNL
ncbi:MAG: hypothetical protein KAS96_11715 [Planctomycetes bacterium]|nr:hypothetical protein [Planctomycetota bacterium]